MITKFRSSLNKTCDDRDGFLNARFQNVRKVLPDDRGDIANKFIIFVEHNALHRTLFHLKTCAWFTIHVAQIEDTQNAQLL